MEGRYEFVSPEWDDISDQAKDMVCVCVCACVRVCVLDCMTSSDSQAVSN